MGPRTTEEGGTKMKKLHKLAMMVLAVALAVGVAGCTGNPPAASGSGADGQGASGGSETVKAACLFAVPDPANGGGFERMMMEGVEAVREKYGWQIDVAENVPYAKISEVASSYCDKGYDVIFFPDNGMIESWKELPAKYPDTWFAMMSLADEVPEGGNALAIIPPKFGYGVIVGEVMANMSESHKIGLVGGLPIGGIMIEFSGTVEGVQQTNPGTEVLIGWAGDYVDIPKHSEATSLLIEQGADVIFTVTGPGYKGVWEAAQKAGVPVVAYAYDSYDIAPEVVAASVTYDGPKQFELVAQMYTDGTIESKLYNVGYEYVDIADFRGTVDAETEQIIRDTFDKISSGALDIPEVVLTEQQMAEAFK